MRAPVGPVRGRCDEKGVLLEADAQLAGLQLRMGGELPGPLAIPALLSLVRQVRRHQVCLSRTIAMLDETSEILAYASVIPSGSDCLIELSQWRPGAAIPQADESEAENDLIRLLAEGHAWLDGNQRVLAAEMQAADLSDLQESFTAGRNQPWTDFVEIAGIGHRQPLHWRLLDRATATVPGSDRVWRVHILPRPGLPGTGFELCLVPDELTEVPPDREPVDEPADDYGKVLGQELAPALRQPVGRIIANADTIRTRMAGPLAEQYSIYATDIANAGRHLLNLIEDLVDLETVESQDFLPAAELIDLTELAREASGILSARANDRAIALIMPDPASRTPAVGERRRVLQILLNLIGNAIHYSPEASAISIACGTENERAWVAVQDQGPGLDGEQAARVFGKFERLGRKGDGGTGLGLYISRKLARAMGGDLSVESTPGDGACFTLTLRHLHG